MLAKFLAVLLLLAALASAQSPKLLLTPQRLKRLQRDRERQTDRWLNFQHRVQTAPASPDRGFELALYYAVVSDEQRGREAVQWALAHPCDARQVALIQDWTGALESDAERAQIKAAHCEPNPDAVALLRDTAFSAIAAGELPAVPARLPAIDPRNAAQLYDLCEYLEVFRSARHSDLRETDRGYFSDLPQLFLLSMRPEQLEHPEWRAHVAALALVTLDPNLRGSQFLQGWAMEDRFTLHDGPGVGYELLWANPYLPGVSYQNMDPWQYSDRGLLIARAGWSPAACWIEVSASGTRQQGCPAEWESQVVAFGHLTLLPVEDKCIQINREDRTESNILWKLKPHVKVTFTEDNQSRSSEADAAGLWRVPWDVSGKVCAHR